MSLQNIKLEDFFRTAYLAANKANQVTGKSPSNFWTAEEFEKATNNALARIDEEFFDELVNFKTLALRADALCDSFVVMSGLYETLTYDTEYDDIPDFGRILQAPSIESVFMSDFTKPTIEEMKDPKALKYYMSVVCMEIVSMVEVDCMGLLVEIINNNLSKFPTQEKIAQDSLEWYKENTDESEIVVKPLIGEPGFWLCRTRDNKYMKPKPFYRDPETAKFVRDLF